MKNFIKNLSDGGLAEDAHAFMEQILDENTNKDEVVNKQEFIDKACAWLKDTMYYLDCGDYERLTHYADTIEEMIDDFRKAMEE